MLEVSHLTKRFRSGDYTVTAVDDVSMSVPAGQFAAIVGASGSGKSTLLSLLGALDKPTSGRIVVGDTDVTALPDRKLIDYRRSRVGFVFQQYNLIPNLNAIENVKLPMEFAGVSSKVSNTRAAELLEQVGLNAAKQGRLPSRLSGGEQQRVSIARALANAPTLVLADEPTGNLDSGTGHKIISLLRSLAHSSNTTIIVVTHDMAIASRADPVFRLHDGHVVDPESSAEILA